jgi:O-acetylhomoserine/O-acetylserine sulfhydrylase-like pyridoxal-dependent enzyme
LPIENEPREQEQQAFETSFKRQILTDCMNPTNKITSSRLYQLLGSTRKARIVSASALLLAVITFGAAGVAPLAPDAADLPVTSIA